MANPRLDVVLSGVMAFATPLGAVSTRRIVCHNHSEAEMTASGGFPDGAALAGRFTAKVGHFGRRRMPVWLGDG